MLLKRIMFTSMLALVSTTTFANVSTITIKDNRDLEWHSMQGSYGKYAVITGNPKKNEFFAVRIKFPANHAIPAHHHLNYEYDTVISGTCYLASGFINVGKTKGTSFVSISEKEYNRKKELKFSAVRRRNKDGSFIYLKTIFIDLIQIFLK